MPASKSTKRSSLPATKKGNNNFANGVKKAVAGVGTKQQQHPPLVNQFKPASNVAVVNASSLASLLGDLHLRPAGDAQQSQPQYANAPASHAHKANVSANTQPNSKPAGYGGRGVAAVGSHQNGSAAAHHNNAPFAYDTQYEQQPSEYDSQPSKPLSPLAQYRHQNQSSNIFNGDDSQQQQQRRASTRPQTMMNGKQTPNDVALPPTQPSQPHSPQQQRRSTYAGDASILSPPQQSVSVQQSFRSDYVDEHSRAAKIRAQQEMREALAAQVAEKENRKRQDKQRDEEVSSKYSPPRTQQSRLAAEPEPNNYQQSQFNATQSSLPNTTRLAVDTFNSTINSPLPSSTITSPPTTNILARNAGDNRNRQMSSSIFNVDPKQEEQTRLAKRAAEQAELQQQIELKKQLKEQERQRERMEEQRDNERWQREQQELAERHGQHFTAAAPPPVAVQQSLTPPVVPLSTATSLPPQPHTALPVAHPQYAQQPLQQQYWQLDNMAGSPAVIEHELFPPSAPQQSHPKQHQPQQYYDEPSYSHDQHHSSNAHLYDTLSQQYQQQPQSSNSPAKRLRAKKAPPIPPTAEERRAADIAARRAKGDAQRKATALGKVSNSSTTNSKQSNLRRQSSVDLPPTSSKGKWNKNGEEAESNAGGRNDRRRHSDNTFQLKMQDPPSEEDRPLRPLKQANGVPAKQYHRPPTADMYGESLAADSTFLAVGGGDAEYDQSIDRYELERMMSEMQHRLDGQQGHNGHNNNDETYNNDFDSQQYQQSTSQPQPNNRYGIKAKPQQRNMR